MDDYGIAVRAGAITPQVEDEAAFRSALGLPGMSDALQGLWSKQAGIREPITLARPGDAPAALDDEEDA